MVEETSDERSNRVKKNSLTRKLTRIQKFSDMGITELYLRTEYIGKNRSLDSLSQEFSVGVKLIRDQLSNYGIIKSKELRILKAKELYQERLSTAKDGDYGKRTLEQCRHAQSIGAEAKKRNTIIRLIENGITYELLYNLYIVENKSLKELMEHFGWKKSYLRCVLKQLEIPAKTQLNRDRRKLEKSGEFYSDSEKVAVIVKKTQKTIRERYGRGWYRVNSSSQEKEIVAILKDAIPGIVVSEGDYSIIKNPKNGAAFQLDIYLPEYSLAIEFNGEHWHDREIFKEDLKNGTCVSRETLKTELCEAKGISLLHVWDSDWKKEKVSETQRILDRIEKAMLQEVSIP